MELRNNQKEAIKTSISNDFSSGIHFHATGTGKSWTAMLILKEFHQQYPKKNILWICEKKDILTHQFSKEILKTRGFQKIIQQFNLLDFVNNKPDNWFDSLNSSSFWGKPFLCVINRAFLTSKSKYEKVLKPIHLVIHDECHSIENNTTQQFYQWLQKVNQNKFKIETRIIGFTATPEKIEPLNKIISQYSIYDAYLDDVILPPKIIWVKNQTNPPLKDIIKIIQSYIKKLPYKKIIVWCGMIEECIETALKWKSYFPNFDLCLDFNNMFDKLKSNEIQTKFNISEKDFFDFNYFYQLEKNGILFCAVKHREGSDIPNIDACIFMDLVSHRSERVFVQCMGRVLRKDKLNLKKYGLVIDLKAHSTIEICNRVQHYMQLKDIFPWKYNYKKAILSGASYYINSLLMIEGLICSSNINQQLSKKYNETEIQQYFKRTIPDKIEYKNRVTHEIQLILEKGLFGNMIQALEILKLTKNIPHVTRGSCGSSLVCYLLGISHVDPIKYNISFARFLNIYRDKLPDIDFDFPHYMRDEVFLKLYQKWGSKVARISNHNYYHEKSALREAIRRNGINKFISKYELEKELNSYTPELKDKILTTQKELEGQFKGFSLHCGGIIYFPNGIPEANIITGSGKSVLKQVNFNKDDISENHNFKIDILSSRGLTQLCYCMSFKPINFEEHLGCHKTIDLLSRGDNIGLTLAETPLMRKALLLVKPKCVMDLAICLSIIRPAAKEARKEFELGKYKDSNIIFDDDVIFILSKLVGCNEDSADKLRRDFCKGKKESIDLIEKKLSYKNYETKQRIKNILDDLRKYGFCKAHAISYAQLVWQLAYQKANNPSKFWDSTLRHIQTCYRKWVHLYEAKCHNISIDLKDKNKSIYAVHKNKKITNYNNCLQQLKTFGYWNMNNDLFYPDCYYYLNKKDSYYYFKGLIASSKILYYGKYRKLVLFIGVGKQKYIEVLLSGNYKFDNEKYIITGKGKMKNKLYTTIECYSKNVLIM